MVIVEVNSSKVPESYKLTLINIKYGMQSLFGGKIILDEDLKMLVKGDENPILLPYKCKIPLLSNYEVGSINQARTFIIQIMQKYRKSFTANAFQKTYFMIDNRYFLLDEIRENFLAKQENRLIIDKDIFVLNEKIADPVLENCMKCESQRKILSYLILNKNKIGGIKIKELSGNSIKEVIQLFSMEVIVSPKI